MHATDRLAAELLGRYNIAASYILRNSGHADQARKYYDGPVEVPGEEDVEKWVRSVSQIARSEDLEHFHRFNLTGPNPQGGPAMGAEDRERRK